MATAVLDFDLNNPPRDIQISQHYSNAFILIRWNDRPIGKMMLPILNGQIQSSNLFSDLAKAAGDVLEDQWLHHYLNWNELRYSNFGPSAATIAVCTRDRPTDLARCLDALMKLPDDKQEIIVVDSCSLAQETRQIVETYPSIRYIRAERPGLNIARNLALYSAKYDIVAFIDDDAVPDQNWLKKLLPNFHDPRVMCVTGLTMPLELETEAQELFEKHSSFGKGFWRVVYDSSQHNPLATGRVGAGANMAIRRIVCGSIGYFDEALDAGTPTCSGGDHEIYARILKSGYRIVYDPAALCWHRHRRTLDELKRAFYGYGVGAYAQLFKQLILERELGVLAIALAWFLNDQFPELVRSILRKSGSRPLPLILSELQGCIIGPWAYIKASKVFQITSNNG